MSTERTAAPSASSVRSLRELTLAVTECTACALHRDRITPVVGEGPVDARLLIVGSVPRRHEDLQGDPYAGAIGNVLDHALDQAGLTRDDVRLTMAVRCRPRKDRPPTSAEVRACRHHLLDEVALVSPEVIVSLGAFATTVVLGRAIPLERVAGYRLDVFHGITLVPTYHPVDVVRGVPRAAGALPRDLKVAKAVLDGELATGAEALADQRAREAARG